MDLSNNLLSATDFLDKYDDAHSKKQAGAWIYGSCDIR